MTNSVERFQNSQWQKLGRLNFSKKTALSLVTESPVLDIGCGDGILLDHLKQKGLVGKGVDISQTAIAICVERGLDCEQADIALPLPFGDASYGTILLTDVLEHLFQPAEVLAEAHRLTRKDIIIAVPNFASLPARLQMVLGRVPENNTPRDGHVYWMTYQVITSLVKQAGFKIDRLVVNTIWERVPVIGVITRFLAKIWPALFALSFVIKAHKV